MSEIMNAKKAWEDAAWELHYAIEQWGTRERYDEVDVYADGYWIISEDILDYYDKACETGLVYTLLVG